MSYGGIQKFAKILSDTQQLRMELIASATKKGRDGKIHLDYQDTKLASLCLNINEAVKEEFMKATMMDPKKG